MNKSQAHARILAGAHETFEHEEHGKFDITLTIRAIQHDTIPYDKVYIEITPEIAQLVWQTREVDLDRVCELTADEANVPILIFVHTSGHIIADGSHRVIRRYLDNQAKLYAYLVKVEDAIRPNLANCIELDWGQGDAIFSQRDSFRNK